MKRLILFCSLFLVFALAACGGESSSDQAVEAGGGPLITVYRAPT